MLSFGIWLVGSILAFVTMWVMSASVNLTKLIVFIALSLLFSWGITVGLLIFALMVLFINWADNIEIKKKNK